MDFKIDRTVFRASKNFSIITPECVEYNKCRALTIYSVNCFEYYEVNFLNKDNLSVFSCYIMDKDELEKVIEYCFNCINYNKAISARTLSKSPIKA